MSHRLRWSPYVRSFEPISTNDPDQHSTMGPSVRRQPFRSGDDVDEGLGGTQICGFIWIFSDSGDLVMKRFSLLQGNFLISRVATPFIGTVLQICYYSLIILRNIFLIFWFSFQSLKLLLIGLECVCNYVDLLGQYCMSFWIV